MTFILLTQYIMSNKKRLTEQESKLKEQKVFPLLPFRFCKRWSATTGRPTSRIQRYKFLPRIDSVTIIAKLRARKINERTIYCFTRTYFSFVLGSVRVLALVPLG